MEDKNERNGEKPDNEQEKKNAGAKKGVLIGTVIVVAVLLSVALPLIVIGHGLGLF